MGKFSFHAAYVAAAALLVSGCTDPDGSKPATIVAGAVAALPDPKCRPMTAADRRRAELALQVMSDFPRSAPIFAGAMEVFGRPQNLDERLRYCVSSDLRDEVARRTTAASVWGWGLPGLTRLELARELGPRDPSIVQDVANAAFVGRPIEEPPFADIRPVARSVLASFGVAAKPWRQQALSAMNDQDALGTSAAQVAGASGDPEAVDRVGALFRKALRSAPTGEAVPVEKGERLVELSYALGVAGPQARNHVSALVEFLNRDVEKGSHFGTLELPPKEVCRALQAIGGAEAMTAVRGARCRP